jgi:hypothetical protein
VPSANVYSIEYTSMFCPQSRLPGTRPPKPTASTRQGAASRVGS